MAETVPEVSGVSSNGHHSVSGGEALSVWRSSGQVENGTPSTSPSYWDTDDDEDHGAVGIVIVVWRSNHGSSFGSVESTRRFHLAARVCRMEMSVRDSL